MIFPVEKLINIINIKFISKYLMWLERGYCIIYILFL